MAFNQSSNPLSRNTSPMRRSPFREQTFSMEELNKMAAKEAAQSKIQADTLPQIEGGNPDYEMDTNMDYAGGEEGANYNEEGESSYQPIKDKAGNVILTSNQAENIDEDIPSNSNEDLQPTQRDIDTAAQANEKMKMLKAKAIAAKAAKGGPSRKVGMNDKTIRKIKKYNKTAKQIRDMQNERSSVKTEWEDTDSGPKTRDIEVTTADKPASKREVRKFKKLNKTEKQIGVSRKASPLNGLGSMAAGAAAALVGTKVGGKLVAAGKKGIKTIAGNVAKKLKNKK